MAAIAMAVAVGLLTPNELFAQDRVPVSEVLPTLFGRTIVLTPAASPDVPNHAAHFKPGVDQLQTPLQFNQQLVTLLATFPIGSSSGGFTYTFNPVARYLQPQQRELRSALRGTGADDRPQPGSLGVGFQRSTYDTFEGNNLRQREILFHVEHVDCCGTTQGGVATGTAPG